MDFITEQLIICDKKIAELEKETNVISLISNEDLGIAFTSQEARIIDAYRILKQRALSLKKEQNGFIG